MKYILFPILFIIWLLDRAFHLTLPHREHQKFKDFYPYWNVVKFALVRVVLLILIYVLWLVK